MQMLTAKETLQGKTSTQVLLSTLCHAVAGSVEQQPLKLEMLMRPAEGATSLLSSSALHALRLRAQLCAVQTVHCSGLQGTVQLRYYYWLFAMLRLAQ